MGQTKNSKKRQTSTPSPKWQKTGIERLYKLVRKHSVSWVYKHVDGRSETLSNAKLGDLNGLNAAHKLAQHRATTIQQGRIVANSTAEMIERFELEQDPVHYEDQSKHGVDTRKSAYENLTLFFGRMSPTSLKPQHGYQYLDARALAGAPARANKEMAQMSTICHFGVRWGIIETNPFLDLMQNKYDTNVRNVSRRQVVRFYLWAVRQSQSRSFRTMGLAAMFSYLTGFRASEVRPFLKSGIKDDGVQVVSAKRKKGEDKIHKLREWSTRLRCVVMRAQQRTDSALSLYLFASTRRGAAYSRSGWGSVWQDAMRAWIQSFDDTIQDDDLVTGHPMYFALQDVRPTAITRKFEERSSDVYDFAAHANPATTHKSYDRRRVKRAAATE